MIYKIFSNMPGFKPVTFDYGLNLIVADRNSTSTKKDSRNGIGKTTFIHIINFCLGSDLKKENLPSVELSEWIFSIELDLFQNKITASRAISDPKEIIITEGSTIEFPIKTELNSENQEVFTLDNWKRLLGIGFFNLKKTPRKKYKPSFRSLFSYFSRTGLDAYSSPFSYLRNQSAWQVQVFNSFLLGLNWRNAAYVQDLKDKDKAVTALNNAIKLGIVKTKGELEAERVKIQNELNHEEKALLSFNVHPQYEELQKLANEFTIEIHELTNSSIVLQAKLNNYSSSIAEEVGPDSENVLKLYKDAGVQLGSVIKKTLEEVQDFHRDITVNRQFFLKSEIDSIKGKLKLIKSVLIAKTSERADLLKVLQTHGALEEYMVLQENVTQKRGVLESLIQKISDIKEVADKKKGFKTDRIDIDSKIQLDYENSRPQWENALTLFNENSQALYNNAGRLIIDPSDKGKIKENAYRFKVEIERSGSEGVSKMKVFCYDLMLLELFSEKGLIDFLIHDSTMYDGVDSRQIANALELAHKKGVEKKFQYICTMNSDILPHSDFSEEFIVKEFVRLPLSDSSPEDSVLGFRFEIDKKKKAKQKIEECLYKKYDKFSRVVDEFVQHIKKVG